MSEVYLLLAGITGMLVGALGTLAYLLDDEDGTYYAKWLGRRCSAMFKGAWIEGLTVVAVSWKGAVAVRGDEWLRAKWIRKEEVPYRVRWED